MKSPCLNCEERKLKCHATCEKYKEFTDEGDAIRKTRLEYLSRNRGSYKYVQAAINKLRRKKK